VLASDVADRDGSERDLEPKVTAGQDRADPEHRRAL